MITPDQFQELYNRGEYRELVKLYEKEENSQLSSEPNAQMVLAAAYFKLDSFSYCLKILENIEGIFSNDPHFFSLYGAACRRIGLTDEALKKFKIAIDLSNSSDHRILNNYANLLLDLGQTKEAIAIWEKIVAEDPSYNDAKINLEKARIAEISSIKSEETDVNSEDNIESMVDPLLAAFSEDEINNGRISKDHKNAVPKEIDKFIPKNVDTKKLILEKDNLVQKCLSEKNFDLGLKLTAELRDLGLPESLVYKYASDCFVGLKKFQDAEINLLHSLLLEPDSINALINLVSLCTMKGDLKRAEIVFGKLCERSDVDKNHLKTLQDNIKSHKDARRGKKYLFSFK